MALTHPEPSQHPRNAQKLEGTEPEALKTSQRATAPALDFTSEKEKCSLAWPDLGFLLQKHLCLNYYTSVVVVKAKPVIQASNSIWGRITVVSNSV